MAGVGRDIGCVGGQANDAWVAKQVVRVGGAALRVLPPLHEAAFEMPLAPYQLCHSTSDVLSGQVYNHVSRRRPPFPGAADHYRFLNYRVDHAQGQWECTNTTQIARL